MLSKTAPVFYGDIRSHERVVLIFSHLFINWLIIIIIMNVALKCFFLLVYCLWVQLLFSTFIDFCKQSMRNTDNGPDSLLQSGRYQDAVTDVEPSCEASHLSQ